MQTLTGVDVLTILGCLYLYDVLKWYYREYKKQGRKFKNAHND